MEPHPARPPFAGPSLSLSPASSFGLALVFVLGLAAFGFLDAVQHSLTLRWSLLGAASALFVWNAILFASALHNGRRRTLEIAPRKQHYVQACAQVSVLLYWGWFWTPVYDAALLIAAQVVFAYAFDMLLGWSRRDAYRFGFGPLPVIFSINLFLWFANDWFYFQLLLVALGFAAKELIQWDKGGRRVHIFNPASFPLAVFALALIFTGRSDITWGQDIAISQFYPPQMYLMLFLVALPGQYLFGVTSMTLSAVVASYGFGFLYFAATGVYFFYDSYIPIAVFLGMHLLLTDPSTSPRTELGRIIFGALYGLSTVALYVLLGRAGLPTFYDKLLQVPLLNLSVTLIDRAARSKTLQAFDPGALGRALAPRQRHLAYISVWTVVFALMSATGVLGDRHPGQWLPFWQQACADDRPNACSYLAARQSSLCAAGSGWACNEAGIPHDPSPLLGEDRPWLEPAEASASFERGCALGFEPACDNLARTRGATTTFARAPPSLDDYPILLRGSKGVLVDRTPAALYARACDQGWPGTCGR